VSINSTAYIRVNIRPSSTLLSHYPHTATRCLQNPAGVAEG